MRSLIYIFLAFFVISSNAQSWKVINHKNNRRKAIVLNSKQISDYVYTEVSELSEGKAYVAQGDQYAYIDTAGNKLTPYVFAEANNFTNGYAIVGDSFGRSILNDKMHLLLPFAYAEVRLPVNGLIVVQTWDGLWGAYDIVGDIKLPLVYDLPPKILSREKIIVSKFGIYGVVNDCNDVIFNIGYQYITKGGYGYQKGKYLKLF